MNQCVIANALQRSGGESELFNLWISEAKASQGWAPLTKIFFWLNNLFPLPFTKYSLFSTPTGGCLADWLKCGYTATSAKDELGNYQ